MTMQNIEKTIKSSRGGRGKGQTNKSRSMSTKESETPPPVSRCSSAGMAPPISVAGVKHESSGPNSVSDAGGIKLENVDRSPSAPLLIANGHVDTMDNNSDIKPKLNVKAEDGASLAQRSNSVTDMKSNMGDGRPASGGLMGSGGVWTNMDRGTPGSSGIPGSNGQQMMGPSTQHMMGPNGHLIMGPNGQQPMGPNGQIMGPNGLQNRNGLPFNERDSMKDSNDPLIQLGGPNGPQSAGANGPMGDPGGRQFSDFPNGPGMDPSGRTMMGPNGEPIFGPDFGPNSRPMMGPNGEPMMGLNGPGVDPSGRPMPRDMAMMMDGPNDDMMMLPAARMMSSGIPHQGPGNLQLSAGGHFLQLQNQIFVFSTPMANEAARMVEAGQFRSILEFHQSQPHTQQRLQMLNAQLSGGGGRPPGLPRSDSRPGPGEGGGALADVAQWVHNQNIHLQQQERAAAASSSSSAGPGGNFRGEEGGMMARGESFPGDMGGPGGAGPPPFMPDPTNPGNNGPADLLHCKVPDENLTPQQLRSREEKMANMRKLKEMLLPEQVAPADTMGGMPPGGMGGPMMGPHPPGMFVPPDGMPPDMWPPDQFMAHGNMARPGGPMDPCGPHMVRPDMMHPDMGFPGPPGPMGPGFGPGMPMGMLPPNWENMSPAQREWYKLQRDHYIEKCRKQQMMQAGERGMFGPRMGPRGRSMSPTSPSFMGGPGGPPDFCGPGYPPNSMCMDGGFMDPMGMPPDGMFRGPFPDGPMIPGGPGMPPGEFGPDFGPMMGPCGPPHPHGPMPGGKMPGFGGGGMMVSNKRKRSATGASMDGDDIYRRLLPAPSPQQFSYIDPLEGQELVITRQVNHAFQENPQLQGQSPPTTAHPGPGKTKPPAKKKKKSAAAEEKNKVSTANDSLTCPSPAMSSISNVVSPSSVNQTLNRSISCGDGGGNDALKSRSGPLSNITSSSLVDLARGVENLPAQIGVHGTGGPFHRTIQQTNDVESDMLGNSLGSPAVSGSTVQHHGPPSVPLMSGGDAGRMLSGRASSVGCAPPSGDLQQDNMHSGGLDNESEMRSVSRFSAGGGPSPMGPPSVSGSQVGPSPGPGGSRGQAVPSSHMSMVTGNAKVQIQAQAPNTIQYMPSRSGMGEGGVGRMEGPGMSRPMSEMMMMMNDGGMGRFPGPQHGRHMMDGRFSPMGMMGPDGMPIRMAGMPPGPQSAKFAMMGGGPDSPMFGGPMMGGPDMIRMSMSDRGGMMMMRSKEFGGPMMGPNGPMMGPEMGMGPRGGMMGMHPDMMGPGGPMHPSHPDFMMHGDPMGGEMNPFGPAGHPDMAMMNMMRGGAMRPDVIPGRRGVKMDAPPGAAPPTNEKPRGGRGRQKQKQAESAAVANEARARAASSEAAGSPMGRMVRGDVGLMDGNPEMGMGGPSPRGGMMGDMMMPHSGPHNMMMMMQQQARFGGPPHGAMMDPRDGFGDPMMRFPGRMGQEGMGMFDGLGGIPPQFQQYSQTRSPQLPQVSSPTIRPSMNNRMSADMIKDRPMDMMGRPMGSDMMGRPVSSDMMGRPMVGPDMMGRPMLGPEMMGRPMGDDALLNRGMDVMSSNSLMSLQQTVNRTSDPMLNTRPIDAMTRYVDNMTNVSRPYSGGGELGNG